MNGLGPIRGYRGGARKSALVRGTNWRFSGFSYYSSCFSQRGKRFSSTYGLQICAEIARAMFVKAGEAPRLPQDARGKMKYRSVPEGAAADAALPDLEAETSYQVLYMGIPYGPAKRFRNVWYRETPEGYKPFAVQGRVRPLQDPQRGPK
jgi:hypothetical protein